MPLVSSPLRSGLRGRIRVPGDKSISHRAALLAALAAGVTRVRGWLEAADTRATLAACEALGACSEWRAAGGGRELLITGTGGRFRQPARDELDLGNSGTGARLLLGLLAGQPLAVTLTGDTSLSSRPMGRVVLPLRQMGARFERVGADGAEEAGWRLPLRSLGPAAGGRLVGIEYRMPVASAQVQGALLLAGLQADGITTVQQPGPCRDHSERMLKHFGADVRRLDATTLTVRPGLLQAADVQVPGDISSAAFLLAAATLVPDTLAPASDVELPAVGINPTRDGILRVLAGMQAKVSRGTAREAGEPVADLHAAPAALQGIDVPEDWVSNCIDEFPVIMALAACARGVTRIRGAAELRVKECDRLAVMAAALGRLGIEIAEYPDGADVHGLGESGRAPAGGEVDACGDHRIAMSLAVLGMVAEAPVVIRNAAAIGTSYPQFVDHMNRLGARLEWQ